MNLKDQIKRRVKYFLFCLIIVILSIVINRSEKGIVSSSASSVENTKIIIELSGFTLYVGIAGVVLTLVMLIVTVASSFRHNNNPVEN
jgi:hypothetical protein